MYTLNFYLYIREKKNARFIQNFFFKFKQINYVTMSIFFLETSL